MEIPEDLTGVYVAGAKKGEDGVLYTNGGRVLGVTERAATLKEAIDKAYASASRIHFDNAYCRSDIGQRALKALED